jgi:hypothetical protein
MSEISAPTSEPKRADDKETAAQSGPSLPSLSLPKGGGAIRGIGEKFAANPVTGTGSMTVPVYTSPCRSGFGPQPLFSAYAVAVVAVGGAVVATLGLGPAMKHTPTLFFCSVILSSWFGGVWPGIFAGLLSAIAMDYYFIPPIYALGISLEEAPDMIAFVASALFVSWLSGEQKRAKDSLREARDNIDAKVREGTPKLWQTEDQLQAGTARRGTAEEGLIQPHTQVARLACITTIGELVAPIAPEPRERIAQAAELVHKFNGPTPAPAKTEAVLFDGARESLPDPPTLRLREDSMFFRRGDYWTIQYQGQIAHLKATRGLHCLASLLGHPGQEFHVSELIAAVAEVPVAAVAHLAGGTSKEDVSQMRTTRFQDVGPILDARAKAEYRRRLADLRGEMEDAERLSDPERAGRARQEMDYIADQLAVAVGLGGRNRRAASQAERSRSTVTKRIKDSIHKIAKAMPALGRHLAARIKTGYFCSYSPNPDRPIEWKVRS